MFEDKAIVMELNRLVAQLHISASGITFRGRTYAVTPENALQSLINILYSECYALKDSYQAGIKVKGEISLDIDAPFLNLLYASNHSKDRTEAGWLVKATYPNGYVEVEKNGKSQIVPLSSLRDFNTQVAPVAGQAVTVFFAKEDRQRQPTFYYVSSNEHIDASQKLTRIYWNISVNGAPVLIDSITRKLNYYNIPFMFKCLSLPSLYFRRDAAVLYIEDTVVPIVNRLLPEIYEDMKPYLEEDVPLFAYKYQNGIGIAENPGAHESFGMNRMALIANALMAILPKMQPPSVILKEISDAFIRKGINPVKPFLNKGSRTLLN